MDIYDQSWISNPGDAAARWAGYRDQPYGLAWLDSFAAVHGKPLSFGEWGLWSGGHGRGGNDNPDFIRQMAAWIAARDVAYHSYFDFDAPDGNHEISLGAFPASGAVFKQLFGPSAAPPLSLPSTFAPPPALTVAPVMSASEREFAERKARLTRMQLRARRVRGRGAKGATTVIKLTWARGGGRVSLLRNGAVIKRTRSARSFIDRRWKGHKRLHYRLCAAGACSPVAKVRS
jgi:hypothetical protein